MPLRNFSSLFRSSRNLNIVYAQNPYSAIKNNFKKINILSCALLSGRIRNSALRSNRIYFGNEIINILKSLRSLYLAIREARKNWRGVHHWKPAMQVFQILLDEERVPIAG